MIVGVPKETLSGERRVALIPANLPALQKAGLSVAVETNAGYAAGYTDADYREKGAELVADRKALFAKSDIVCQVNTYGVDASAKGDLDLVRKEQTVIGLADPLGAFKRIDELAKTGVTAFGMELIPRITRAQSMDVLSSMATIAGYKAVLLAANHLPRMFPMFMTAAGTVTPARVFVIGAGVAGLQAIATAKRLGAVVKAFDVRPVVKEQVESVGGKFVQLELDSDNAEDKGGYAKAQGEEFLKKQRELMGKVVAESDVVITTAAIPGRQAPVLVTADMVEKMATGSIIVDLAAERGGNVEPSKPGKDVDHKGVTVMGPVNLPATVPYHASQMYSKNMTTFLLHLVKDGKMTLDTDDEITRDTLMATGGEVTHARLRDLLGLAPIATQAQSKAAQAAGGK